jgi:hypothetical protein
MSFDIRKAILTRIDDLFMPRDLARIVIAIELGSDFIVVLK